jgi:hypothetical protein
VLRNIPAAFPELDHLSEPARDFVLWHRKGRFELGRTMRVPPAISGLFADQDGLFASACNQYRASMNEVADWAKARDLMDHTGIESVPRQVSLLEAHLHQPARVALLQRRDGYGPALDVGAAVPESFQRPAVELLSLLAQAAPFDSLDAPDQASVARAARPLTLGPTERLVIQGMPSTGSLFLLAEGGLEVVVRHDDGRDVVVDTMRKGDVIGEMSLLSGAPHTATVRAAEGAVVFEIGAHQHVPLRSNRPAFADGLQALVEERRRQQRARAAG